MARTAFAKHLDPSSQAEFHRCSLWPLTSSDASLSAAEHSDRRGPASAHGASAEATGALHARAHVATGLEHTVCVALHADHTKPCSVILMLFTTKNNVTGGCC